MFEPTRPTGRLLVQSLAGLALVLAVAGPAQAGSADEFAYPESRVWTSVVRLVRLDLDSPIVEKDRDNGYLLFEFTHQGKSYPGSVEVFSLAGDNGPRVRVVVSVSQMPSYVERMVLTKLERKLRRDFGAPEPGKRRDKDKPDPSPKDDDGDGAEGDDAPEGSQDGKAE